MLLLQSIMEWIKLWWGYLGVLGAICAFIGKTFISPIIKRRRKMKQEKEDQQKEMLKLLTDILDELKNLGNDVGSLQHDRLQQAYAYYMKRGWCESSIKESLISMFDSYSSRGRNHLYKSYKQDFIDLPEVEPGVNWGAHQN